MGLVIAYTRAHPILVSLSMMIFLRGLVVQGANDEHIMLTFAGTIRKASKDRG